MKAKRGAGKSANAARGGRLSGRPADIMQRINTSIDFDQRLAAQDIAGSLAHCAMLVAKRIVSAEDGEAIARGLEKIRGEIEKGAFPFRTEHEDIHLNVEARLGELIGPAAGRLHTARSRNDQVATGFRLWVRDAIDRLDRRIAQLQASLIRQAQKHHATIMPGFTHLQTAQPVTFGHHLLAYVEMLGRDRGRLADCRKRLNESPLGAGALAGTSFPIDRARTAKALGFDRPAANSLDAVSDRDFALDLVYACLSIGLHLSRLGEDVVLWSSSEFGFVRLADEISTGSSIMPQKRNPDIAELLRGRAGRPLASLAGLAMVLKGLPLAYDRDLEESKAHLFSAVDNCLQSLEAARLLVRHLAFDGVRLAAAASDPDLLATDTAENLVAGGRAFREVHGEVGRSVLDGTHRPPWDVSESLRRRSIEGGPDPAHVAADAKAVGRQAAVLRDWAKKHI